MGNFLDRAKEDKETHEMSTNEGVRMAVSGMQGWRLEMEDAHILQNMPSMPSHTLCSVFDGHGGSGAAIFAAERLIQLIEDSPEWKEYATDPAGDDHVIIGKVMTRAYFEMDRILRIHQDNDTSADKSGCTAVSCMITPKYVICVNAGDSRAVIGSDGNTIPLSEDHKPNDEVERNRVLAAGGTVHGKRVDGDLAVSRAFGDFQYKNRSDLPPEKQKVSCEPDVKVHVRTQVDDILLVACDGLWDVFSNTEAVEFARELMCAGENSPALLAEEMLDESLVRGSKDNISCCAVFMPGCKFGSPSGGGVTKRRQEREEKKRLEEREGSPDESA